ncbi:hypothetical protein Acsp01_32540 [Actinoplanes sp. NBRC 101535]|nr:hypothetical protein Acsp01_32540 [Actinoplanes sp. NBRC 101535]
MHLITVLGAAALPITGLGAAALPIAAVTAPDHGFGCVFRLGWRVGWGLPIKGSGAVTSV